MSDDDNKLNLTKLIRINNSPLNAGTSADVVGHVANAVLDVMISRRRL